MRQLTGTVIPQALLPLVAPGQAAIRIVAILRRKVAGSGPPAEDRGGAAIFLHSPQAVELVQHDVLIGFDTVLCATVTTSSRPS
jgi:hypothetical protein